MTSIAPHVWLIAAAQYNNVWGVAIVLIKTMTIRLQIRDLTCFDCKQNVHKLFLVSDLTNNAKNALQSTACGCNKSRIS